jgi:hypothetical protein
MKKFDRLYVIGLAVVLMSCVPAFQAGAEGTCYVRRGNLYRSTDGFWRLPFSNGCNYSVFVTVHYQGRSPGVCVGAGGSAEIVLYYGSEEPDAPITWEAEPSKCGG